MKPTINEKLIAYLTLLSGLCISSVAVYYSVVGLTAIFAAAAIPIIIMGSTLEVSKLVATVWLKNNWNIASAFVRTYLLVAIAVLMLITSMGIFGFLSKAHSDQSLVSGDVVAKIAVYDEKIKTSKENIDVNRKALKQLDEAVDQVMGRSTSETGADKAVAVRRSQAKERTRLQSEIAAEQKSIVKTGQERAPIAAEVRKVEAEVGPIKYIAAFVYGATDPAILEKAVIWVIILLIIVFDPLAVVLLLASQISFHSFREREKELVEGNSPGRTTEVVDSEPPTVTTIETPNTIKETEVEILPAYEADEGPLTPEQVDQIKNSSKEVTPFNAADLWNTLLDAAKGKPEVAEPVVLPPQLHVWNTKIYPPAGDKPAKTFDWSSIPPEQQYVDIDGQKFRVDAAKALYPQTPPTSYIQNEEQQGDTRWKDISAAASSPDSVDVTATTYIQNVRGHAGHTNVSDSTDNVTHIADLVRDGRLPFYKVPTDLQDEVKRLLQDGS